MQAGGETPYKLLPPSNGVDYNPIIRDIKQLLSHTHFAVCSKALQSLGMIAEGVGEEIYSQFRPLITTLIGLFKDKKVCNAVGSCLDKMFANVFSFDHLLDSKDSLPSSLDEKKQKNALVRKGILEYLCRCVKASGTYGTRGNLSPACAVSLTKLACSSLNDSDASARKGANDVLVALLTFKDESIVKFSEETTSTLQTTNPRAFKSLQQVMKGPSSSSIANAGPRPATAPNRPPLRKVESNSSRPATAVAKKSSSAKQQSDSVSSKSASVEVDDAALPSYDEAVEQLSALGIPQWGDSEDNGGVLACIQCKCASCACL
jgi:cytoskeleton-associated protein 5